MPETDADKTTRPPARSVPAPGVSPPPEADEVHRLEQQRREKRDRLAELGAHPYGRRVDDLVSLERARRLYDPEADAAHQERGKDPDFVDRRPVVRVAGRVMLHRDNGRLVWMQLRDHSVESTEGAAERVDDLQIAVSKKDCDELGFQIAKLVDLGDIVVVRGPIMKTRKGEITIWADELRMGAKSLALPPEKWAGLQDVETRYRKRYIDLYANPDTMRVAKLRSRIVSKIRRFLDERGYTEVETPMLQPLAGGAAARPFVSRLNALDIDVYLRIAPELYLKRLLVGGLERVYEINRNFRNEGVDRQHNPEFTMLEVYHAFGDSGTMMELTETLLRRLAHFVAVSTADPSVEQEDVDPESVRLPFGDVEVDWGSPFRRIAYADLFEQALGFSMSDVGRAREAAKKRNIPEEKLADPFVINELFEQVAEPTLDPGKPTFVTDYPSAISPLTRPNPDDPTVAERWDLFIGHMEIAPAYTELNDPDVQAEKFREQLQGADEEEQAFRTYDADFIEALKVGMPPAGGLGIGVDRVVMLLANQRSIRDVILFPFMRPLD